MRGPWIATRSGKKYEFESPSRDSICIEDIAHSLAHLCRYTGHTSEYYSVAEHSVLVSRLVSPENALAGLLHDAPEAYVGDMSFPLKKLCPEHRRIEAIAWRAIASKFSLALELPAEVHQADADIFKHEAAILMPALGGDWGRPEAKELLWGGNIKCWPPHVARAAFLREFGRLGGGYNRG